VRLVDTTTEPASDVSIKRILERVVARRPKTAIVPATALDAEPKAQHHATGSRSYAWETIVTDVAAIGLFTYARIERGLPLARSVLAGPPQETIGWPYDASYAGGLAAWMMPAPDLDLWQRRPMRAVASFLLRLTPFVAVQVAEPIGGVAGAFFPSGRSCGGLVVKPTCDTATVEGARLGADIGFFGAAGVAMLAGHFIFPRSARPTSASTPRAWQLAPQLALDPKAPGAGIGGTF
jgi:hypothetical protein